MRVVVIIACIVLVALFSVALVVFLRSPVAQGPEPGSTGVAEAQEALARAEFETGPDSAEVAAALEGLAGLLIQRGRYSEAREQFDRALYLNPGYPDLYNYRGIALCELERYDEATEAFRTSAELGSGHSVPRLNLAFAYLRAGQYKEAEAALYKAKEVAEQSKMTETEGRKFIDELQGRYDDAQKKLEERVEKSVKDLLKKADVVTQDELKGLKKEIRDLKKLISSQGGEVTP